VKNFTSLRNPLCLFKPPPSKSLVTFKIFSFYRYSFYFFCSIFPYLGCNLENLDNWLLSKYTFQQLLLALFLRLCLRHQMSKSFLRLSRVKFDTVDGGGRWGSASLCSLVRDLAKVWLSCRSGVNYLNREDRQELVSGYIVTTQDNQLSARIMQKQYPKTSRKIIFYYLLEKVNFYTIFFIIFNEKVYSIE
jgi:hypothetical protein